MDAIKNRYEFVMFFDVENGNPNGDPDAGNMPRTDPETSLGIVTDVCLKRKIRNYVDVAKQGEEGYKILINPGCSLETKFKEASENVKNPDDKKTKASDLTEMIKPFLCANYFDVRTFGSVVAVKDKPGKITGPVQLTFAKSIDQVYPMELTIIRQMQTTEADRLSKGDNTMGKKNIVPYGLYRAEGYVSAMLAQKTGFSEDDLELLWNAVINMFEHDRSAARGKMCLRKLLIFKHKDALGCCPAHLLFDKIKAVKNEGVEFPRSFTNYTITVDREMPDGVELIEKL